MRKFTVLLRKEVRELLTAQILLPFLVTVLVFVAIGNLIGQQSDQAEDAQAIAVLDRDGTEASAGLAAALEQGGFAVVPLDAGASDVPAALADVNLSLGLIVPDGFEQGLAAGEPQELQVYAVLRNFSFFATRDVGALSAVLLAVNEGLSGEMIAAAAPGADPVALKNPVRFSENVVIGTTEARASVVEVLTFVSNQTTFIPIILFIVIVFAAQMIATTIANEKENKTLETLLAAPVNRTGLVGAKMVAASLVALLSAGVYMFGLRYYMQGVTEGLGGGLPGATEAPDAIAALGLALGTGDYTILGLTLFLSILVALAIAVILGAFAENVRAVQSLLAPLMVLLMIPYFLTLFVDLEQLGPAVRWFVYAIPFSHAFTAAPNLFLGNYQTVWIGIGYLALWCAGLIYTAGRIFSTDRILTMKLDLRRKRT
ncbi:MAG: ABC transporter permease [Anaerosomatales bacterium]|nr:ABC transporter permease [Anaerosomatales bacterium]